MGSTALTVHMSAATKDTVAKEEVFILVIFKLIKLRLVYAYLSQ